MCIRDSHGAGMEPAGARRQPVCGRPRGLQLGLPDPVFQPLRLALPHRPAAAVRPAGQRGGRPRLDHRRSRAGLSRHAVPGGFPDPPQPDRP